MFVPTIIIGPKGTGKTCLLQTIAAQVLPDNLKCNIFREVAKHGKVISFDFAKNVLMKFLIHLMIFYLCFIFKNSEVDDIEFDDQVYPEIKSSNVTFLEWQERRYKESVDAMIEEYIRLTNIAFVINSKEPPIFLF
jgi:GTPase SAR1 family protein